MSGGDESNPIAEDVEMLNCSLPIANSDENLMQIDDRKRLCTERASAESFESPTMSLSQVSNALNSEESLKINRSPNNRLKEFKPTQLEIIEEDEFIWKLSDCLETGYSPVFVIGGVPWKINYLIREKSNGNQSVGLHLEVADGAERSEENSNWAVCAEFILGISNPNPNQKVSSKSSDNNVLLASPKPDKVTNNSSTTSLNSSISSFSKISNMFSPQKPSSPSPSKVEIVQNFAYSISSFHRFCANELDWGFHSFCPLNAFKVGIPEINCGPLATTEGSTEIIVKIRIVKDSTGVLWHNFDKYDSKEVTGFVGLLNQGATCYMNSFVQSIFLTNEFRSAVYKIPTESVTPTSSIPLALQRIFYKLQTSSTPPSTTEMTKSFGWDTTESFMQHDVQEFSRVLMDDLENKMKGSEVEGTVERLFRGKLKNVLKCTEVDYESVREESFYDLQLTIKGVKDLKESFERYVAAEMLCGDNQYRTDDFGLQDAKKFVTFEHFPPVLHVHLERYAFDMMAESTVKIHDRFEFPVEIELDPYLSETSPDRDNSQNYWLHSVLVHAGDGHGGHYFVYIRHPSKPDCWYKFDDTKVIPCTQREAVDENFGGSEAVTSEEAVELQRSTGVRPYRYKKFTSAYLLVYVRESEMGTLLAPIEESQVPEYLVERIKSDDLAEARRRHERQQQFLYMDLSIITDSSMKLHSGSDLCDPDSTENTYRCKREDSIADLCQEFLTNNSSNNNNDTCEECDSWECYTMVARRNKTVRTEPLLTDIETRSVGSLTNTRMSSSAPVTIFLRPISSIVSESEDNPWIKPIEEGNILIFFKWFDPSKGSLTILGSIPVKLEQEISSLVPAIKTKLSQLGIEYEGDFSIYEEFKPSRIVSIDYEGEKTTFKGADLRHGDILLFEPRGTEPGSSVVDYFSDLLSWHPVDIKPLIPTASPPISNLDGIRICTKWNYKQLCKFIGDRLEVNPDHLRIIFTSESNCLTSSSSLIDLTTAGDNSSNLESRNNLTFLKSENGGTVKDFMIGTNSTDTVIIKYEITEEPVGQVENQVRYYIESSSPDFLPRAIYLTPYVSTVTDLFKSLGIPIENHDQFRLLEVVNGKIKRVFAVGSANESLTPIDPEKCSLFIEEVGKDESFSDVKMISCFTFEKNPAKPFGIPFKFEIKPEEPLKLLKSRLAQRLNIPQPESISLFLLTGSRDRKLEDLNEILYNLPGKFGDEDHLAVMMIDPRRVRSNSGFDGAIRFRK